MNAVGGDRGDVRLSGEMQALMKGRKYVKESELTRQVLLEYAKQKGAVKLVELVRVQVEQFGGSSFVAVLDDTESKVRDLKRAIEDKQGVLRRFQALFLFLSWYVDHKKYIFGTSTSTSTTVSCSQKVLLLAYVASVLWYLH